MSAIANASGSVPGAALRYSRKDMDGLTEYAGRFGAKGLVWLKVEAQALRGALVDLPAVLARGEQPGTSLTGVRGHR